MNEPTVTLELTAAELKRLIDAMHDLIHAEQEAGKEPTGGDKVLLLKLSEHF
jgi:hypothetical protein